MEKRGLISRCRETKDRQTVIARITPEGLKLLSRLDEPVQEAHRSNWAIWAGSSYGYLPICYAPSAARWPDFVG